jgi:predicted nucleotidyltransferase
LTGTVAADREREIKTMLRETFRGAAGKLAGHKVFLFGSRARGRAEPRSDFDIGVRGDEPLDIKDFYAIEDRLEALPTLYTFDWVDFNRVDPAFRRRAMQAIEILYE